MTKISREIGTIGNYYGNLSVRIKNGRPQWSIENYDGHHWEDIPQYLYDALLKFQEESQ